MIKRVVVGNFSTNCYIFSLDNNRCAIIDPGANGEIIQEAINQLGLKPSIIICTHGHLDHIGAADYLIDTFSDPINPIPLAASAEDALYFGPHAKENHKKSLLPLGINEIIFETLYSTIPEISILLEHGTKIEGTDFEVLNTPGHTEGSISLYHQKSGSVFTGDCLMSNGVGRTDLPGGNLIKLEESIYSTILKLPPSTQLYSGHGPATSIERVSHEIHLF